MALKLTRMRVQNYRLLEDVVFEPATDISVLIGANNAGKSNVIDPLVFLRTVWKGGGPHSAFELRHGFERIVFRHDTSLIPSIDLLLSNPEGSAASARFSLAPAATLNFEFSRPGDDPKGWGTSITGGGPPGVVDEFRDVVGFLSAFVHVDPFRNVQPQSPIDPVYDVQESGWNLAQVLHYHYTSNRERFDAYEEAVRRVLPEVDIIETPILAANAATVTVRFRDDENRYDLWQVSSGVKDVMVLVAAVHFAAPDALIVLEEPENHLHPGAQKALMAVIEAAAEEDRKQILLTTHSEVVLGQVQPEQIWFVDRREARARLQRLADAEIYEMWDRLGIERERFIEILGDTRQVLVILEGRTDYKALEPLWDAYDLSDVVLARRSSGGGYEEIARTARSLQDGLERFKFAASVFVVLDANGERDAKLDALREHGFDDATSHVWSEKEIESYLAIPETLGVIAGRPTEQVQAAIDESGRRGKEHLENVLESLGIAGTPTNVIVRNALANHPTELPDELREVPRKVRRLLKLPEFEP